MADSKLKKQDEEKSGLNSVAVAVTGAVVGAGIAVAGVIALKDKKSREKVKEALTNAKDQVIDYMEGVQKQAQNKKNEIEEKLTESKEKLIKETNKVKKP